MLINHRKEDTSNETSKNIFFFSSRCYTSAEFPAVLLSLFVCFELDFIIVECIKTRYYGDFCTLNKLIDSLIKLICIVTGQ